MPTTDGFTVPKGAAQAPAQGGGPAPAAAPAATNPYDAVALPSESAKRALTAVQGIKPDEHAAGMRLAPYLQRSAAVSAAAVRGSPEKAAAFTDNRDALIAANPALARWLAHPDHAAIAQDDVPALAKVYDAAFGVPVIGTGFAAFTAGVGDLEANILHLAVVKGYMTPEEAAPRVANLKAKAAALRAQAPADVDAFKAATAGAGPQGEAIVGAVAEGAASAYHKGIRKAAQGVAGWLGIEPPPDLTPEEAADLSDTKAYLNRLGGIVGLSDTSAILKRAAGQAVDVTTAAAQHPAGLAYASAENLANAVPSLAGGLLGATVAGPEGTAAGTFVGSYMTEFGAWIDQRLGEAHIDQTDPAALAAAYRDTAFLSGAAEQAGRKALGTALVDAIFGGLAGHGVAQGGVGKAAGELGEQVMGEMASEAAGQVAARGRLDVPDVILEGLVAGPQAAAEVGIGVVGRPQLAAQAVKAVQAGQDAKAAVAASEALPESKAAQRVPVAVRVLADEAGRARGTPAPAVATEAWDAHWTALGRSPEAEATRLTGSATAYGEARATGSLAVPYGRFLEALQEADVKPLLPAFRFRPDAPTVAEAEAFMADLPEQLEAAATAATEAAAAGPDPAQAAVDDSRAAEIEASLGVPEGASLLFQSGAAEPSEGQSRPMAADGGHSEQTAGQPLTGETGKAGANITGNIQPGDPLRATADAIDAATPGAVGGLVNKITGAEPVAQAVRDSLRPAEPAGDRGSAAATGQPRPAGAVPPAGSTAESVAQAAQRDPGGTAAALRELADIRDRQAATQGPTVALRRKLEAAIRAAGRQAKEAGAVARILSDFVRVMQARFPEVPTAKWESLMVRFAKGAAPEGAQRQGERGAYDRATRTIHLFEKADASTAVHESAHWIVDVLGTLAANPASPDGLRAMWADLGGELGVPLTTAQHEKLARSFEAYVYSGEAPSAGLRRAFAVLRDVMLRVYQSVRAILGVDAIAPDIRAVFDRMLATDQEIAAAQAEAGLAPLFPDDAAMRAAGVDPDLAQTYRRHVLEAGDRKREALVRKALAALSREKKAERTAVLAGYRAALADRVDSLPAVVALASLRGKVRLSADAVAEAIPDRAAALKKAGVVAATGLSPDAAAELFGFPSADALADGLLLARNRDKLLDVLAREQLAAQRPDLIMDRAAIREQARRNVGESADEDILAAEVRILTSLAGVPSAALATERNRTATAQARSGAATLDAAAERAAAGVAEDLRRAAMATVPTLAAVRETARAVLSRRALRDIRPGAFLMAVQREGRAAAIAVAEGKFDVAAKAKSAQALNLALFREAARLSEREATDVRVSRALASEGRQKLMGQAPAGFRNQANHLLARFGLARQRPDEAADTPTLADWLDALRKDAGEELSYAIVPVVPDWLLTEAAPGDWRGLTAEQLHELRQTAQQLYVIARDYTKAMTGARIADLEQGASEFAAQIVASRKPTGRAFQAKPPLPAKWLAEHAPIDRFVYEMDGGPGGIGFELVLRKRNEGEAEIEARRRVVNKALNAAFGNFTFAEKARWGKPRTIPGVRTALSHEQVLCMALLEGTATGRQRNRVGFTEAEVAAAMRTLTARDAAWLNAVWAAQEALWPESRALMERVWGVPPAKLEAVPFTVVTADGETLKLTGGYSKIKYADERAHQQDAADVAGDLMRGASLHSQARLGARHDRLEHVQRTPRYDFGVVMEGLGETITALALIERVRDINFVLRDSRVRDAMVEHYGQETYDQFKSAMRALVTGKLTAQSATEHVAQWLRSGTVIAKLGVKVSTNLVNMTGLMNSAEVLGPSVMVEAARLSANPAAFVRAVKEMHAESSDMATRAATFNREEADARLKLNRRFNTEAFHSVPMLPLALTQLWCDLPTYRVAKRKALAEGHDEATAIAIAVQTVKDTQGSGLAADVPAVMRDHKNWTLFMGFLNRTMNLAIRGGRMRGLSPLALGRMGITLTALYLVPELAQGLMRALRGDDQDDDELLMSTMAGTLQSMFGGAVGLREAAAAVRFGAGYKGPADTAVYAELGRSTASWFDGELDERDFTTALSLSGILLHLPTQQALDTWRGLEAYLEHDAPPSAILLGAPHR